MRFTDTFRTGPLSYTEWSGFWKATADATLMTGDEFDQALNSLRTWLSSRYLVEWTIGWQRHCWVEGDWVHPERTLTITIGVAEVLTVGFLGFVQEWLKTKARLWRVLIPTDNTDENLVIVYSHRVRINPTAEADLSAFVDGIRPKLAQLIIKGHQDFNLPFKPHPPLPDELGGPPSITN